MTGKGSNDDTDPWNLVPRDELPLLSLDEVLAVVGRRPSRIDDEDTILIAVRVAPIGFRAIMAHLAHESRMSYSRLALLTSWHGVARLDAKPPIQLLRQSYEATRSAAMISGDLDALGRLNQSMNHDFQHSQAFRTTLTVAKTTQARLGDLAMVCGLTLSRVVIYAILESTLTLDNTRKYRDLLADELSAFVRYVEYRNRVLRLGS
jgi:hypothetical protein